MTLYEASIDKHWTDFTDAHKTIRKNLEKPIEKFISGEKQNLVALWGPYGQGKTQLMYHLFKYSWEKNGIALFTKLEKLLPDDKMGSDGFKDNIETLVKQNITKIRNGKIDDADLLNNECKNWLKEFLKNNPIREDCEERAILLIDEMEQNYLSLLNKVTTDDNSPLKDCTAQNGFMIIATFAPTSQYEAMTGEAEKRRWESHKLPTLPAEVLREENAQYGNFTWWVSKGRLGLAFKILDSLQNRDKTLNYFTDFVDFDKEIGSTANVPSIDTDELARYVKIRDYIIELFPHSEVKDEDGVVGGKIIKEVEFINILKDGLTEEKWEAKEIELFSDYLKYVISALSNEKGFLLPHKRDGNDPERILTLLKTAIDFAIETEGKGEVIASIYDRIYKWKNFEQFYYIRIFERVSGLNSSDGSVISYDLLPRLFPLPITSPIVGKNSIEKSTGLLTGYPSTDYIAKDIKQNAEGQIRFLYFINNQKLKQFLDSVKVKDFLSPDKSLVCIVLENKENIKLDRVAGWLKAQNRMKIEYPSKMLRDFLISFMDYYQLSSQNKELELGLILEEKVEEESKENKSLSRKLDYYKNMLNEFLRFNSNLTLNRAKFEVENKDIIKNYQVRYDKFPDVVGLSFCEVNDLSTFHGFKQIIMGRDDLRELRTGVPGLLKGVSISKIGKKPLKLSTTLETIKRSYSSELDNLTVLANLVNEEDFIKLSSEENSRKVLIGIFRYIKTPQYDKSSIVQEIDGAIKDIEKLKKSREELNKTFSGFKIKESKSERTKEKWNGILKILGEVNSGYVDYLICNFAEAVLEKFKNDTLSKDQNWLTLWQNNKQYVKNYNERLEKIVELKYAPKWLKIDKDEIKKKPQEGYSSAIKNLTSFQDEVDFNAVEGDNLNWDSFNEELEGINNKLDNIIKIEEKLEEIVTTANELNKILRR